MVRVTVGWGAPAHAAAVACVAFRADGRRLASGSADGSVLVWDTSPAHLPVVATELGNRSAITALAWNPAAADLLAAGSADGTVAVWRVVDDRPPALLRVLPGHGGDVTAVAWLPDGRHVLCLAGGAVAVWHAFDEVRRGELPDCVRLCVSSAGLVATAGPDGMVAVRDLWRDPSPMSRRHNAAIEECAWSPDSSMLALARSDGSLQLLTAELVTIRTIPLGDGPLRTVAWSADGNHLLVGAYDAVVLDVRPPDRLLWRRADPLVWTRSLASGGTVVAAGSYGDHPHVFDLHSGDTVLAPPPAAAVLPAAPPSVPFRNGTVAATGRQVTARRPGAGWVLWEHDVRVGAVAVLADRVVASAAHRLIRLLLIARGGLATERGLTLHAPEPVKHVALLGSAAAPVVVAAAYDLRLWAWTVDWSRTPAAPRLVTRLDSGVATLTRLDDRHVVAADHHGRLTTLALGRDGAVALPAAPA